MDPRQLEALAKRLGENANDTEALNAAYEHGQSDPRGYAVFLEKAGTHSVDPAMGAHWFCEAANVWTASLNDAHRAERALVRAVDTDPLNPTAVERLVALHAEKGNTKGIAGLHQRRAKNLEKQLAQRPDLEPQLAAVYMELARVFNEELSLPDRAIDAYRKAAEHNREDAYSIYQVRELLKAADRFKEALPWFEAEQALIQGDPERQAQLYADEAEVCRQAGDTDGLLRALRGARSVDPNDDPGLKQQLASAILELVQEGKKRPEEDVLEAVSLFVSLAETYDGEHGHSYSVCALGLEPGNDRAAQLAMYYGDQIGKSAETAHHAAAYLAANPQGAVAEDARNLVAQTLSETGDDALIAALTPADDAAPEVKAGAFGVIARAMVSQGRAGDAQAYYSQVVAAQPENEEAVAHLADALRGKDNKKLRDLLMAAAHVEHAPSEQRHAWFAEIAELCEGPLKDVNGAIEARQQLVLMDPSDEEAADHLETTLEGAGKWEDLAQLLARRAEVDPDPGTQVERELRVAQIHQQKLNNPEAAGDALARAAKIEPDDEERTFQAVDLLLQAEQTNKAVELLQALLAEMLSGDARGNYSRRLGEILESTGHLAEAGGAYAEAGSQLGDAGLWGKAQECFVQAQAWEQAARATSERRALVDDLLDKAELCSQEADYLTQLGDAEGAVVVLKEALENNPAHEAVAVRLEQVYNEQDRHGELVSLLLTRAGAIEDAELRLGLRKRAAFLQREELNDEEGMRQALLEALEDGDDPEVLRVLADDAEAQGQQTQTVEYLQRLREVLGEEGQAEVALRLARLLEDEGDEAGALEQYLVGLEAEPKNVEILSAVAHLQREVGDVESSADSYKRLLPLTEGEQKLGAARCLADILAELERPEEAISAYKIVLQLDEEDLEAVERLRDLAEGAELWEDYAEYHAQLVDMEGDEEEASRMALRLAEVLNEKLERADDALAALVPFARAGDVPCRDEYERLGDSLGKQAEVANSLVEWCKDLPAGPDRNRTLRRAYDRFIEVGQGERAIEIGLELVRMKGAAEELAKSMEETAAPLKNIEALQAAFAVLGRDMSGPPRAEEMVRQAEVLAVAGLDQSEAVQHGEQALTSTAPAEVEPLLARLAEIAGDAEGTIGVYERQVTRCKSPEDRIAALCRASEVAAEKDAPERVTQFFEIALQAAGQAEGLDELRLKVREADETSGKTVLREALCAVMSKAGKGARDGGRSRGAYLARAASVSYEDLKDVEKAFGYLKESLVAHTDEDALDQLVEMGDAEDALVRVADVIGETLEQVHDGPLVRLLLRRRFELRSERLDDQTGAGEDLKKLYDLSPSDGDIAAQLEDRYRANGDDRGLVQLYEDQILRGRDQAARAELARKVALLWQDTLEEPREAADAWRRVLRMNSGDAEAKEGLERAKQGMRKVSARQVAESEEKNRAEVEAKKAEERAAAQRREEELAQKAEELKARHSQVPLPPTDEEVKEDSEEEAPEVPAPDAPPPDLSEMAAVQGGEQQESLDSEDDGDEETTEELATADESREESREASSEEELEEAAAPEASEEDEVDESEDTSEPEEGSAEDVGDDVDEADDVGDDVEDAEDVGDDVDEAEDVEDDVDDAEDVGDEVEEEEPEPAAAKGPPGPPPSVAPPPPPSVSKAPPPPSISKAPPPPQSSGTGGPPPPPPATSKGAVPPPPGGKVPPPPVSKIPPPPPGGKRPPGPPPAAASGKSKIPPPPGKKPPPPPPPRK